MKRIILCLIILTMVVLSGCVRSLPADQQSLEELLQDVSINDDFVFIDANGDQGIGIHANRIEMLDFSTAGRVLIHIIVSADLSSFNEDYMIMIDDTFIYSTKNMTKWRHQASPVTRLDYQLLAMTLTDHFDTEWLDMTVVRDYAMGLVSPRVSRTQGIHTLRGMTTSDRALPDHVVAMMEICFTGQQLLELHFRLEYTFDSTKQQSNYIEGVHVYYSQQIPIDFPFSATFIDITTTGANPHL